MLASMRTRAGCRSSDEPYASIACVLEEIERECISGLVEVLREEGLNALRHTLRDMIGWYEDYDDPRLERAPIGE